MALARGALSKHGFPRGFRYTPKHEELITLLADRIRGRPMAPQVDRVFNDVRILDYHPQELYERYRAYAEAGCIYFFSRRESVPSAGTKKKASEAPAEDKKWRPTRTGNGGGWKPSGGAKVFETPLNEGGAVVGRMVTMVFYDRWREGDEDKHLKTHWGVHEFTVLLGPEKYSKLAVYRLYKVKNGGANKQRRNQPAAANVVPPVHRAPDVAVQQQNPPSTSSSVVAWTSCSAGTSASAQAFAAPSTSTSTSQEQMPLVSTGQVQQFHDQYAFGLPPLPLAAIPPLVTVAGVPDYFGFAAQSEQGTAPPAMTMNQFGTTLSPPAAASAPAAMSPPQPVVLPPEDYNMDDMLSALSDEEVPAGADILPPSSDGSHVFFSLDELCGTDCPLGDVNNNQAAF